MTFSTNADYDSKFKESVFDRGNTRNGAGYVQLQGFQFGPAIFDTSATGGSNGSGGTGGNDANNDFSNFTISADLASSEEGPFGMGFLLRLDNNEANGYFAAVLANSATSVEFDLYEGAGLNEGFGSNIFSTVVPLNGLRITTNTFFPFEVTATDGDFAFDFGSGAATASFTDTSVIATTGQVGFVLTTASPDAATRLDNFAVVPEPATSALVVLSATACLALRRCRFSFPRN
ncbi:MAG: PEP-CTERM sorting domain-containing protein, partial [Chthoniobacteraceae bacterium]